ncbi:MAG: hypothetical protein ACKO9F_01420, partial [Caldilinea sp.]
MQTTARVPFSSLKTEGGLLPAELLQQLADARELVGLQPESYHLLPGERLNEAVNRAWNRCRSAWQHFDEARRTLPPEDSGTTLTRERWLLVLFQELGYGRLQLQRGGLTSDDGTPYPISHLWEETPIHLLSFRQPLDRRADSSPGFRRSPHSLMQELLNRSQRYRWGLLSNGLQLRLLHDNVSLRRAAYLEFDLESILVGDLYAEFALVWLLCHQSRVEKLEEGGCWLERWSTLSIEQGTRAMDALREGVAEAVEALGSGFLAANRALRAHLQNGDLSLQAYYQQLRRLVYRLIFLFVAEDRALLLLPTATPAEQQRYSRYYSLRRLRTLAEELRGDSHTDLYRQVRLLFTLLRTGYAGLGLPALGSFLFSERSTPDLDSLELSNQALLAALRALTLTIEQNVRRRVDYRNLDSEELGSVYESLLELLPALDRNSFVLRLGAGSERKTTGSHYTPRPLVECLLDSALEPVVAERLDKGGQGLYGSGQGTQRTQQEAALLSIKVCDGAMGSGHLLIGAGRRLAKHLAHLRTGEGEPTPADLRAAMRDVVRHCLYGVDSNDMAVELCKVALWMETMEPGRPLSFLDAHIQCGNSLVGVTPTLNIDEIPDDAFQPVSGDDKTTAMGLRRRNKKEREGQLALHFAPESATERYADRRAQQMAALTDQAEDAVAQVAEKEDAYAHYLRSNEYQEARWEADTWTAAFFWPIPAGDPGNMNAPTQHVLRSVRA